MEIPSGTTVEIEPSISNGGPIQLFVWISGDGHETVTQALYGTPEIAEIAPFESTDGGSPIRLYRVTWAAEPGGLFACARRANATIMKATGSAGLWSFVLRLYSQNVSEFTRLCRESGLSVTIQSLTNGSVAHDGRSTSGMQSAMTKKQYDALVLAYERGYFSVPRLVSAEELADELGISSQAVSERIRRGSSSFIEKER